MDKVLFHHDNAQPYTARAKLSKFQKFGWELMLHPTHSLVIATYNSSSKEVLKRGYITNKTVLT